MFSGRTYWDLSRNRLSERLAALRAAGRDVLDLTLANPTEAGLVYDGAALAAALGDERLVRYAPTPMGDPEARRAVAAEYAARGVAVDPDHLLLTASTSEAYAFLFKLLADPGDTILVPRPSYPLFEFLARLESVVVQPYPLVYQGGWRIDLDALRALPTERVRAIVVVHPNHPTGSFLRRAERDALRALGRPVISDEVFADYAYGPDPARVATLADETEMLAFALSGLSKVAGLPQLKLGWMAVAGPSAARRAALERLEIVSDTYLSVGTPVQLAAPRLLALGGAVREQIRARVVENRAALSATLGAESAATLLRAEGGWAAVLQIPRTRTEEEWALLLLEEEGVLVHPGYFFDFAEEAYLVVSLLAPPARFREAAARLGRRLG